MTAGRVLLEDSVVAGEIRINFLKYYNKRY